MAYVPVIQSCQVHQRDSVRAVCVANTSTTTFGGLQLVKSSCVREIHDPKGRYAVSVAKDGTIVGQIPDEISRACTLFLLRGGSIVC